MAYIFPRSRRGLCLPRFLACSVVFAWTVLAFNSHTWLSRTTCSAKGVPRSRAIWTTASNKAKNTCRRGRSGPFFLLKGGEIALADSIQQDPAVSTETTGAAWYEEEIRKFLFSKTRSSSSALLLKRFEIQGWRWHTKSLQRDAGRLHKLASRTNLETVDVLRDASDYVVGFNLMGLHKIEARLFFPWMREKLTGADVGRPELTLAFATAMDVLESDRKVVARLGESIAQSVQIACNTQQSEASRSSAISEVAKHSEELREVTEKMISLEDSLLAPSIGATVPTREQKSFNTKVLRKLGILDSRLHLVGMHEVVEEGGDPTEKELFDQAIPSLTRQLIPRWKRKLYQPKTHMLE